jgi:hypothetical protein
MIGQTVSHYRILEKLGDGAWVWVNEAEDTELVRREKLSWASLPVDNVGAELSPVWIVYFALAISLLMLAILLARRRASLTADLPSWGEHVTFALVFVNVAALLVALVALYVMFQARGPARNTPQPANAPKSGRLPPANPAPAESPDVRLEFEMSGKALGVLLVNESASDPANEISCQARLWDLDDPDDDSFSDPIATDCGVSDLGPRGVLGPARLAKGPSKQPRVIEKGDRFFGYVAVSCPGCVQARSYAVYFVLGVNQGWQAAEDRRDLLTARFTRETAETAAKQFLARTDKQPIPVFSRL